MMLQASELSPTYSLLRPKLWGYTLLYMCDRITMIMRNSNRLINDFKNQAKDTIWKHLDAMAANYAVFSTHLNGLSPFLTGYDVYLYCNDTNVVILCLDCCGTSEEQVYEESESLSPMLLADGCEPRVSVVYKLSEAIRQIKERLQNTASEINVYGLLLTEAEIINSYELYRMWDANNLMVIDELRRLKYRRIKTNNDYDLACSSYVRIVSDTSLSQEDISSSKPQEHPMIGSSDSEYDEFEKLLNDFINKEYDEMFGQESNDEKSEDDLDEGNEEWDSDTGEEDSSFADDEPFPSGEIEQNNNISVKVEILRPIPNPREELDKLVGCTDIKRCMDELVALTSYNKMMHELFPQCKQHAVSLHSIFLGRPGTGKTTVCKIFGSLLRQAGALSKGHVVVCDRGTFLGTLWGDEERSVRQVLEVAKGGVLMIDEAYLLNGKHDHDPGKLVIQLLMNILADESQRDIAVVLCGYKEPMMKMLDMNPGLQSRFPNKFEFKDFTVEELLEITRCRVKDYDYIFTTQAWEKYSSMLTQAYKMRDPETWGNARFIANQLERIYIQHANRCVKHRPKDKQDLLMLTPEDISPIEIPHQKTKIGF